MLTNFNKNEYFGNKPLREPYSNTWTVKKYKIAPHTGGQFTMYTACNLSKSALDFRPTAE